MKLPTFLADTSVAHLQKETWGYGCVGDIGAARRLREVEDFLHLQKKFGGRCLNETDQQVFYKRVNVLTEGKSRSCTTSYDGKFTLWAYENPGCIPRPHYVTYCESLICDLQLEITSTLIEHICDLNVDILVEEQRCDLAVKALTIKSLTDQGCELDVSSEVTQAQCDLAAATVSTTLPCDIDVSHFIKSINTL